jgi:hypothetical protein
VSGDHGRGTLIASSIIVASLLLLVLLGVMALAVLLDPVP